MGMEMSLGGGQQMSPGILMNLELAQVPNIPLVEHLNYRSGDALYRLLNETYRHIQRYCWVRGRSFAEGTVVNRMWEQHRGVNVLALVGPSGGGKSVTIEQTLRVFSDHAESIGDRFGFDLAIHYVPFSDSALDAQARRIIARSNDIRGADGECLPPGHRAYTTAEYAKISEHHRQLVGTCTQAAYEDYAGKRRRVSLIMIDPSTATVVPGYNYEDGNNRGYAALRELAGDSQLAPYVSAIAVIPDEQVTEYSKQERDFYARVTVDTVERGLQARGIVFQPAENDRRGTEGLDTEERRKIVASLKAYGASSKGIDRSHAEQDRIIQDLIARKALSENSVEAYYHLVLERFGVGRERRVVIPNEYNEDLVGIDQSDGAFRNQRHTYLAQGFSVVRRTNPTMLEQLGITP